MMMQTLKHFHIKEVNKIALSEHPIAELPCVSGVIKFSSAYPNCNRNCIILKERSFYTCTFISKLFEGL